jgi:hypothetical protein
MHIDPLDDPTPTAAPCAGGLLAGTLALMTGWAAPERSVHCSDSQQRALMARKIASNLYFLREHPDVAPGLRRVIGKLHQRWVLLAQALPAAPASDVDLARTEMAGAANALH